MDKNNKRQIIRDKSVYKRKQKGWTLMDEIQFRCLWFTLSKAEILVCKNVRPKVEILLVKHGKQVEELEEGWYKISPM